MKRLESGMLQRLTMAIGLLFMTSLALAESVYVQAKTAQLRSGKTSLDQVVANLKYGEALEVINREGSWLEVRTAGGKQGWIFGSKTSSTKPSGGDDGFAQVGRSMRRGDASGTTASAGARGLDKVSEGYANRTGITPRDREAVDRMTAYQIPDQDVEEFLKEGGLGEYAK
ncbi:MAG: SH3 domain-containing protein [Nitrospiraceae bacterium]